jgi:hypothetical protein
MDCNSVNALAENSEVISSSLNFIAALFYAFATIYAASVAIWSVRSWRKEFTGKRKIELVSNTLTLLYNVKSSIQAIRSNLLMVNEGTTLKATEVEDPLQKKFRVKANSIYETYNRNINIFNNLLPVKFKFMAEFGKDTEIHFDKITSIINTILVYAENYPDAKIKQHGLTKKKKSLLTIPDSDITKVDEELETVNKQIKKYESFIYNQGRGDTVEKKIDNIISEIQKYIGDV